MNADQGKNGAAVVGFWRGKAFTTEAQRHGEASRQMTKSIQSVIGGIAVVAFYGIAFWRIARQNAGNRVIECGSLTLVVMFALVALTRVPGLPDWIAPSIGLLLLFLALLTMVFLLLQGIHAIRHRKRGLPGE